MRFLLAILFAIVALHGVPACVSRPSENDTTAKETDGPKAKSPREQAGADFNKNVQRTGLGLSVLLILTGVAVAVASFTHIGRSLDFELREGLSLLAAAMAVPLMQYGLQAWGMIAMDIVVWASLAASLATGVVFLYRWNRKRKNA